MVTGFGKVVRKRILVADVKPTPFNPPGRTTDGRLEALREEIRVADGILQPIALSSDLVLLDGNRRWTIAQETGVLYIEALVYEDVRSKTPQFDQLFVVLNKGTLAYTPKDRLLTILNGGPAFTTTDANMARRIYTTMRTETLQLFKNKGATRDVWQNALGAARILNSGKADTDAAVVSDINKLVFWMYRYDQMENLKHFLKGYRGQNQTTVSLTFNPQKLRKCIDTDKPLPDSVTQKAKASARA